MKLRKAVIVYKKSTFQIQAVEHREPRFIKLLAHGHNAVTRVKSAHEEHYSVLSAVQAELAKRGIEYKAFPRAKLNRIVNDVDIVISVGGDGTFLEASHFVESVPLLGINSSQSTSLGHFCLANEGNFCEVLDRIVSDTVKPISVLRLELELNGSILPELVMNETLICHSNPAATSRYFLDLGDASEEQRSGGIWVGTPAGSTGALKSAGGPVMPILERRYQYVVREPGPRPSECWKLLRGIIPEDAELRIMSLMRTGVLYIDGQHIDYRFALGDVLVVRGSRKDLVAYMDPGMNDAKVDSGGR